jgi:hypothetical protein
MKDRFPSILDTEINAELNQIWNYVAWLVERSNTTKDSVLFLSIKKDVIIHLWSIVEGLLFYILEVLCSKWSIVLDTTEYKYSVIHTISSTERVMIARENLKKIPTKSLDFCKLIDLLHDKDIIDIALKKKLHAIREHRNWVHVSKKILGNVDFKKIDLWDYMSEYYKVLGDLKVIYTAI